MILLDTGLRTGELVNLKMDDVHMDEGYLKVMGKGKKERIVPICNNAQRMLQRYLFRFRPKTNNPVTNNVFLSTSSQPLTENSMKLMFTRLAKRSGVCRLHAHLCRHAFATRFLINGGYLDLTPYLTLVRDPADTDTEADNVTSASVDASLGDTGDRWLVTLSLPKNVVLGDYSATLRVMVDMP